MKDRWSVDWDTPGEALSQAAPPSGQVPRGWPDATAGAASGAASGGPDYRSFSVTELRGMAMPPLAFVVDGLFPGGSLTLFAGREKEGKSLAVLDLAASVAAGEDWAGRTTTAGPVLYCPAEDNLRTVLDRIERRYGPTIDTDERPLGVLPLSGVAVEPGQAAYRLDLNDPGMVHGLRRVIERVQPVLMVLDCLRELHAARENESDDMTVTMRPLRQLAHEFNVAVIVVHHASKNAAGGSRGSTAIAAACDAVAGWTTGGERPGDGPAPDDGAADTEPSGPLRATLTVRGRDVPKTTIRLELGNDLRFWPIAPGASGRTPGLRQRVLAALTPGEERTAVEIAAATGASHGATMNTLAALLREPGPPVERLGTGQRGDPFRYRPHPAPPPDAWSSSPFPLGFVGDDESGAGVSTATDPGARWRD